MKIFLFFYFRQVDFFFYLDIVFLKSVFKRKICLSDIEEKKKLCISTVE